jgi:uncharacterized protein with HEPN domain
MSKTSHAYIQDIIQELEDILLFTQDGQEAFEADIKTQKAVIRSYEVIGEICKRLPTPLRTQYPAIEWRKLITFRDFLAHNYERVAFRYIWQAVQDVPALHQAMVQMLADLANYDNETS